MFTASSEIHWNGWTTTLTDLIEKGWEVKRKPKYRGPKNWHIRVGEYIYLVHIKQCMLGRITNITVPVYDVHGNQIINTTSYFELDFLLNKKQFKQKMLTVYAEPFGEMTGDDTPFLYKLILRLQEEYPKKNLKSLPTAEIIELALHA